MVKKIIICDYCKKEIAGDVVHIFANTVDSKTGDIITDLDAGQNERDYHTDCAKKILNFANGLSKSEETKKDTVIMDGKEYTKLNDVKELEDSDKEVKKTRKKKLDIGKIMALKKAGWSYEKIADEMGTTKASIASTIYAYKKKMKKGCE